jgi:RHS repeat-associated protein
MCVRVVPSSGTATDFLLDGIEIAEEIASAGVTSYVGPGLISKMSGTTQTIYHADGLGSTRAMSGSSQVVTESSTYDAYGNAVATYSAAPNFGYAGQYRYYADATWLHYLKARYYDPVAGRFVSRDPIRYNGGRNLYQYARSRPTSLVDPSGRIAWAPIIGVIGIVYSIWEGANWVVDWYICGLALQSWYECARRAREVYPDDCQRKWKFCEGERNDVINSCPETTWREYAGNPIYGPTL